MALSELDKALIERVIGFRWDGHTHCNWPFDWIARLLDAARQEGPAPALDRETVAGCIYKEFGLPHFRKDKTNRDWVRAYEAADAILAARNK